MHTLLRLLPRLCLLTLLAVVAVGPANAGPAPGADLPDIGTPADYAATCLAINADEGRALEQGTGTTVAPSARLDRSLLWDDVQVGADASLRECIVTDGVTVPPGTDIDALRQVARERFQVAFAGALGPLSGKAFRIGHLGDQNPASILGCLAGIEAALRVQGIPFGRDGVACAVDALRDYIPA